MEEKCKKQDLWLCFIGINNAQYVTIQINSTEQEGRDAG